MRLFIDTGSVAEVEEIAAWGWVAGAVDARPPAGVSAPLLAASIRHPEHVVTAAKLGCEVATLPAGVLRQMLAHPLTTAGIQKFTSDWESRPEFAVWLRELVAGS